METAPHPGPVGRKNFEPQTFRPSRGFPNLMLTVSHTRRRGLQSVAPPALQL